MNNSETLEELYGVAHRARAQGIHAITLLPSEYDALVVVLKDEFHVDDQADVLVQQLVNQSTLQYAGMEFRRLPEGSLSGRLAPTRTKEAE